MVVAFLGLFLAGISVARTSEAKPSAESSEANICVEAPDANPGVETGSGNSWTFEGCWAFWGAGPCYDIFRDASGLAWLCRACGTTGTPSPNKCSTIGDPALSSGYWCS